MTDFVRGPGQQHPRLGDSSRRPSSLRVGSQCEYENALDAARESAVDAHHDADGADPARGAALAATSLAWTALAREIREGALWRVQGVDVGEAFCTHAVGRDPVYGDHVWRIAYQCGAESSGDPHCTRGRGHGGMHESSDGTTAWARWPAVTP